MKALEYGACALIQKPALGTKQYFEESRVMICDAIHSAHQSHGKLRRNMMSQISNSGVGGRCTSTAKARR
jgi:chemotaxis response regulator CheB